MQKQRRTITHATDDRPAFVIGWDCGYSNVKVAYGYADADEPTTLVRPANAAPLHKLNGLPELKAQERAVNVNREPWFAFTAPSRSGMARAIHADYPSTDLYRALFLATLDECCASADTTVVDRLVTGLPVNQARDEKEVAALRARLEGLHEISDGRVIEVREVVVYAQPIGTLFDVHSTYEKPQLLERGSVLVLDVGFYSVDWVLFLGADLIRDSSGTSMAAMSVFIKAINDAIIADKGGKGPGSDKIEMALQGGEREVIYNGDLLELAPYMQRAAATVCREALAELQAGQRFQDSGIDFAILSGGGGQSYRSAISEILPDAKLLAPLDPVLSNAIGFWCQGV